MNRIIVATFLALALGGCAQLNGFFNALGEQDLAVQIAAVEYIKDAGNRAARVERAANVRVAVDEVEVKIGDGVTVDALRALVLSRLPADADPTRILLLSALMDVIAKELGGGVLGPDDVISLRSVLANVREATSYFGIA